MSLDDLYWKKYEPRIYTCWDFTVDVWEELTGFDLRSVVDLPEGEAFQYRAFVAIRKKLQPKMRPSNPSVCLMSTTTGIPHAGVFFNGSVLHLDTGGPISQTETELLRFYKQLRYYDA